MAENISTKIQLEKKAAINVEFVVDPDWTGFEFITKKKGAQGPSKEECETYYADWYVSNYHSS